MRLRSAAQAHILSFWRRSPRFRRKKERHSMSIKEFFTLTSDFDALELKLMLIRP